MSEQEVIIKKVRNYVQALMKSGIPLERAFLFGSYAKGDFSQDSDIDVALISDIFSGFGYDDRNLISGISIQNDYIDIEPVTFSNSAFNSSNPFINEIIDTGIEIKLNN